MIKPPQILRERHGPRYKRLYAWRSVDWRKSNTKIVELTGSTQQLVSYWRRIAAPEHLNTSAKQKAEKKAKKHGQE